MSIMSTCCCSDSKNPSETFECKQNVFVPLSGHVTACAAHPLNGTIVAGTAVCIHTYTCISVALFNICVLDGNIKKANVTLFVLGSLFINDFSKAPLQERRRQR
ncbi:hypothetical protein HanIR_Chr14g0713181 [Helianthus annuus]|nr:hypothetical protein HanIR_Chr14g0713181 [Helianthus annuus]